MKYPMPGICGGMPGEPNKLTIRYESDDPVRGRSTPRTGCRWTPASGSTTTTAAGAVGAIRSTAIPQAVLDDVLDEYVSVAGAERDYGVVLTGSLDDLTLAVDETATKELRESRDAADGVSDRV